MTAGSVRRGLLLAFGFAVGGWFGLIVAATGLMGMTHARQRAIWLPTILLAAAAIATVLPDVPAVGSLRPSFATDRPWAAAAGLAAGVLLAVVFVESVATGRSAAAGTPAPVHAPSVDWSRRLRQNGVLLGAAVLAIGLRLTVGGDALSAPELDAVARLRDGGGLTVGLPPLAVVMAAVSPIGTTLMTALLAGGVVVRATELTRRFGGVASTATAAVVAAVLPLTWALPLAPTLGLLSLTAALLVLEPDDPSPSTAAVGGALLGLAALARPELTLVAVAALGWCAVRRHPLPPTAFMGAVVAFGLSIAPWVIHVWHRTGTPGLTSPLGEAIDSLGEVAGGTAVVVVVGLFMAASIVAVVTQRRWLAGRLIDLLPLVTGVGVAGALLATAARAVSLYPAMPLSALVLTRVAALRRQQTAVGETSDR